MSAPGVPEAVPARLLTPALLRSWAASASAALAEHAEQINELNVFPVPDGDTGTNSSMTFRAGFEALAGLPADADAMTIMRTLGQAAALGARGNSGVILSQMLRGILDAAVDPARDIDGRSLAAILTSAADAGREAVGDPRDGTMLSVASDAAAAARAAARDGADLSAVCLAAADAARDSLIDTPNHLEVLAAAGVVDAGGRAVVVVLDSLAEVVTGRARPPWRAPILARRCDLADLRAAYSGPSYEVMYVLTAAAEAIADVQSQLVNLGDSLAVVGSDSRWKVHVHVDDPSAAIDIGRSAGAIEDVRVSYLLSAATDGAVLPVVIGVDGDVARMAADSGFFVADGAAVEEVGLQLADALDRFGRTAVLAVTSGEHAAVRADAWQRSAGAARVSVLACHHAPQLLAAVAVYDASATMEDNLSVMGGAIATMRCASVHRGRDGVSWAAGNWRSVAAGGVTEAVAAAVRHLCDDSVELVTVLHDTSSGLDADELRTAAATAAGCEVEIASCRLIDSVVAIGVE